MTPFMEFTSSLQQTPHKIYVHESDLPDSIHFEGSLAIDTETMGLNLSRDRLCVVQLSQGDGNAHLVRFNPGDYDAPNLKKQLARQDLPKLYHFARFDLASIYAYLGVMAGPVYCTRTASKLVRTFTDRHGLKNLCHDLIGVDISKQQQSSDWGAPVLNADQVKYAASDVLFLHALKAKLDIMLAREQRTELAQACFDFLPTRAKLDLVGWDGLDIFEH